MSLPFIAGGGGGLHAVEFGIGKGGIWGGGGAVGAIRMSSLFIERL